MYVCKQSSEINSFRNEKRDESQTCLCRVLFFQFEALSDLVQATFSELRTHLQVCACVPVRAAVLPYQNRKRIYAEICYIFVFLFT